jgi:O-antigen ligase
MLAFVIGTLIASLLMFARAFVRLPYIGIDVFYYKLFAWVHPSYLSMYLILSTLFVIKYLISYKRSLNRIILGSFIIIFLMLNIYLLQSKAGIFTMLLVAFYLLYIAFVRYKSLLKRFALFTIFLTLSLIIIDGSGRMNTMKTTVKEIAKTGHSEDSTTGIRLEIWKITLSTIPKNLIFGVGSGDIKPILIEQYTMMNTKLGLLFELNVHNQYLETLLGQGLVGFSLLLLFLYFGFKTAIKSKEWLITSFLITIALGMLPESMLNIQAGTTFIGFFYYFFLTFSKDGLSLNPYEKEQ